MPPACVPLPLIDVLTAIPVSLRVAIENDGTEWQSFTSPAQPLFPLCTRAARAAWVQEGWGLGPDMLTALITAPIGILNVQAAVPEAVVPEIEVSILLTDNARIQNLNAHYRGKDAPTNVLSFAQIDPEIGKTQHPNRPLSLLGDIVLARETLLDEARQQNRRPEHYLSHMIVHGMLHLMGQDHEAAAEARWMMRLEKSILAGLDFPDPYSDPYKVQK